MRSFHIVRSLSDTSQRYLVGSLIGRGIEKRIQDQRDISLIAVCERIERFALDPDGDARDAKWSFGDAEFIFMFTPKMRLEIQRHFFKKQPVLHVMRKEPFKLQDAVMDVLIREFILKNVVQLYTFFARKPIDLQSIG